MATATAHASANTATTGFNGTATNPANAYSSNDQYATFVADANPRNDEYAHNWRGFDFSSIPAGSTINSVHVHIEHKLSTNWSTGFTYCSVWPDVTAAAALAPGVTGSIGDQQYGHANNTGYLTDTDWDITMAVLPSLAQLQGTNFGVRVQHFHGNNGTSGITTSIDDIYIVVDYTASATTETGSFTANAVAKSTQSGSFSANATVLSTTVVPTTTIDASFAQHVDASFTADSTALASVESSFTADAIRLSPASSSLTVDAITLSTTVVPTTTIDAELFPAAQTQEDSFATDAVVQASQAGSFSAASVIQAVSTGSFTTDAFVEPYFTVDAYVGGSTADSFTADAAISLVGKCVWVSPPDLSGVTATPTLVFTMPVSSGNMHFQIELDTDSGFSAPTVVQSPGTGWEYWDGDSWEPIPAAGVPNTFSGNEARYTVQNPLSQATWYRRVRAGVIS